MLNNYNCFLFSSTFFSLRYPSPQSSCAIRQSASRNNSWNPTIFHISRGLTFMDCIHSSNHRSDFLSEAVVSAALTTDFYREQVWERRSDMNNFDSDIEESGGGDDADEDEIYDSTSIPKLQFRNDMSQARWNEDFSMAEVLKNKGKMATTTGVVREGKLLCSIEETLFLSERGAVSLEGPDDPVTLKDLYGRIGGEDCGCSWELFEAYRHLKSLGYIIVRHGFLWTVKTKKSQNLTSLHDAASTDNFQVKEQLEHELSGLALDDHTHSGELNPHFDVYLPNSKFRKSSPGNPSFKLYVCRGLPLSKHDIKILENKCDGIPLKICHVDHGRISYLAFKEAQLPELP